MIWSFEIVSFRSRTTDQGLSLFRECQKVVALGKLKKVVSVQTINTTGEYPLFRYCFHISSPGIIPLEKEWYPHFRLYIGRFPHFLDIRQFIGKPRNVDTLLYREVSTFKIYDNSWKSPEMWILYYIGRFPHSLDIRQCKGFP